MANYYVSTTGNNANAGTTTAGAWATIARAGSAGSIVAAGDTVNVLPGTWVLSGFSTNKANITYLSTVLHGAILDGRGSGVAAASILWTNNAVGVIVDGFDLSTHGRIGYYTTADDCEVRNLYVHDVLCDGATGGSGGAGINTIGDRTKIHHNFVTRINQSRDDIIHIHGIYCAAVSATVYNNIIIDVSAFGIHQWHGADASYFYNNTVANCGTGGFVIGSGDSGQLPQGTTDNKIYNNISVNNGTYGIRELGLGGSNTYVNNILFGNPVQASIIFAGSTETGRISASANFINYLSNGTGDYHLSSGSAAIGACNTTYVPANDYDYVTRPQNSTYDVGAYEFIAGGDTTAPILTVATGTTTGQTTADLRVTTNEAGGTLYYWASTNAVETAATIIANASGTHGGFLDSPTASSKLWHITGLTANTTYYGHFVQDDAAANRSNVIHTASFTTLAGTDTTAPVLSLPTAASSDPNIADLTVTTDEANGTLYCWVTQNATETAANIIATTSDTGLVTTTGVQAITVDLLLPNTNYYGHFVHVDAASNQSNVVHTTVFQTEPVPAGVNLPSVGGNFRRRFHIR